MSGHAAGPEDRSSSSPNELAQGTGGSRISASASPAERTGWSWRPAQRGRLLSRQERLTIIYGILCVVLVLVVIQLWLLTATMNAHLGGDYRIVWPAAAASAACFGLNLGLLWYLYRLEK